MPSLRRLWAGKWSPAILFGFIRGDDIAAGAIEHAHMQDDYIESEFGAGAGGVLRKILRIWVQDERLFSEETDEF